MSEPTKIPKNINSCVMCSCGQGGIYDTGWHISIKGKCFGPEMSERDCGVIYHWLVQNDFVDTKEFKEVYHD